MVTGLDLVWFVDGSCRFSPSTLTLSICLWLTSSYAHRTSTDSPLSSPQLPHSFIPDLKPTCCTNPSHRRPSSSLKTDSTDFHPDHIFWAISICLHNTYGELRPTNGWDLLASLGRPSKFQLVFASWLRYCTDVAHRRSNKRCTMFGRLLHWYTIYNFLVGALAP